MLKRTVLLTALLSTFTHAAVSVVSDTDKDIILLVSEQYSLGDNDSLTDAKRLNLEQAKRSAAAYAGQYVESSIKVENAKVTTEQVRVLSAGFLEVLTQEQSQRLNEAGKMILTTKAKIRLSKASITDGLRKLKTDPERLAKIADLEKKNAQLQNQLYALSKKINDRTMTHSELLQQREAILKELDSNRVSTKRVFEKGTLFQLAQLDLNEFDLALKDINDNVFGELKHSLKVRFGSPKFIKNKTGKAYNILIPVSWSGVATDSIQGVLNKYLYTSIDQQVVNINYYRNNEAQGKVHFSERLTDYFKQHQLVIRVQCGQKFAYLPISSSIGFVHKDTYSLRLNGGFSQVGFNYEPNPVQILNVTESELKSIDSIQTDIVLMNRNELRGWQYNER